MVQVVVIGSGDWMVQALGLRTTRRPVVLAAAIPVLALRQHPLHDCALATSGSNSRRYVRSTAHRAPVRTPQNRPRGRHYPLGARTVLAKRADPGLLVLSC